MCSTKSPRYHGMLDVKETNDADVDRYHPGWLLCRTTCPHNCAGLRKSALRAKLGADHAVVADYLAGRDGAVGQRGRLLLWQSALGVLGDPPPRGWPFCLGPGRPETGVRCPQCERSAPQDEGGRGQAWAHGDAQIDQTGTAPSPAIDATWLICSAAPVCYDRSHARHSTGLSCRHHCPWRHLRPGLQCRLPQLGGLLARRATALRAMSSAYTVTASAGNVDVALAK